MPWPMRGRPALIHVFGRHELDLELHELRRDGERLAVQPKVFALLAHLVRNRERAVSRSELQTILWPHEKVGRTSLTRAVAGAREAVGDDGDAQRVIRTLRSAGYRFVAEVAERRAGPGASVATPFVGREAVLASLERALDLASAGHGSLALLRGPAGIGKTRTADEVRERARARGFAVLAGSCLEGGAAPPFWPWVQLLRAMLEALPQGAGVQALGSGAAEILQAMPALAPSGTRIPAPPAIDPVQQRFRLHDSVAGLLRRGATARPVLVLLDDLHCADLSSLELLEHVARGLRDARVLVVGTHRDAADESAASRSLARLARIATGFDLGGLSPDDLSRWVELWQGHKPEPARVSALHQRTGGNPLFVSQLLGAPLGAATDDPPRGVRDAIRRQLERFTPRASATLVAAAALGNEFALGTLASVCRRSPAALLGDLDGPVRERVLLESPEGVARYRFAHGLFPEVLLADQDAAARARLHARVAKALLAHYGAHADAHVEEIARHFVRAAPGGDALSAVDWCVRAAERALARTAYLEAAQHFEAAQGALDLVRAPPRRRAELLVRAAEAYVLAGNLEAARERFRRGAGIARALRDKLLLARAAIGVNIHDETGRVDAEGVALVEEALATGARGALRARLLSMLAKSLYFGDSRERSLELARDAVERARRAGDTRVLAEVLRDLLFVLSGPDRSVEREATFEEVAALARSSGDRELCAWVWSGRVHRALERGARAELEQAMQAYAELARELRQPAFLWYELEHRSMLALLSGELADAERLSAEALRAGVRVQPDLAEQWGAVRRCILLRELGRGEELAAGVRQIATRFPRIVTWRAVAALFDMDAGRLDAVRATLRELGANELAAVERDTNWEITLAILGELCGGVGEGGPAAAVYTALLPCAARHVAIGLSIASYGSAERYLGLLARAMGNLDASVAHLERAVRSNDAMGARAWAAHARLELAQALVARGAGGDGADAAALAARARAEAQALGLLVLARRAGELDRATPGPVTLLPRARRLPR